MPASNSVTDRQSDISKNGQVLRLSEQISDQDTGAQIRRRV